jgi:hypothetical protein
MAKTYKVTLLENDGVKRGLQFEEEDTVIDKAAFLHMLAQYPLPDDFRLLRFERIPDDV